MHERKASIIPGMTRYKVFNSLQMLRHRHLILEITPPLLFHGQRALQGYHGQLVLSEKPCLHFILGCKRFLTIKVFTFLLTLAGSLVH